MAKKLLYLIPALAHGGAEHQLALITSALDRERFVPHVYHLRNPDYVATLLREGGVRVDSLGIPNGKRFWPRAIRSLVSVLRTERPDLVHTSLFEADVIGGAAARIVGIPAIATLCNMTGDSARLIDNPNTNRLKFATSNAIWSQALRRFHRHGIAISHAVKASAVQTFGLDPRRLSVIYRGLPRSESKVLDPVDRAALLSELGVADARPLLLSVGRLAPQKGQRYLIEALADVVPKFPDTRLLVVGMGWLQAELEQHAKALGVLPHVQFLGKRDDVWKLMELCDIFVFPSLFEGLGVSLVEAATHGRPCVATRVGPIPEILDDGVSGLLVPPQDPKALAEALCRLASDPAFAAALGRTARERASERFVLERVVADYEELYDRLLADVRSAYAGVSPLNSS